MKRSLVWLGLLGVMGAFGVVLGSGQLAAFLAFFLLFLLAPIRVGPDFGRRMHTVTRWTLIGSIFAFTTVFMLSALLSKVPIVIEQMQFDILLLIMIQGLSWCFALMILLFVAGTLIAALGSLRSAARLEEPAEEAESGQWPVKKRRYL